jgi:hypothetical protein
MTAQTLGEAMGVTEASPSLFSEQPARIHPEWVDGRKARGKRGNAPPPG